MIGLHDIIPKHKAELGYWLGEQFWGKGIMTKAIKKMLIEFNKKFKTKWIYAKVYPWDIASGKVLKKNRFEYEGTLRKNVKKGGKFVDTLIYAKIK